MTNRFTNNTMRNTLERYLRLNVGERRGALTLLCLSALLLASATWLRHQPPPFTANLASLEQKAALLAEQTQEIALIEPAHHVTGSFDPNTADAAEMQSFGVPDWLYKRIENYRNKGGKFKNPDDLARIYGMPDDLLKRLRPHIVIASHDTPRPQAVASIQSERFEFDPNSAGESDLLRLGLSKKLVKTILNYRNKGGTFRTPDDFAKIYGMNPELFSSLRPYITISAHVPVMYAQTNMKPKATIAPIDVNTATIADWQTLPGVGAVFAGRIVRYREVLGGFARVEAVAETHGLPDSVFQKISPYLKVSNVYRKVPINQLDMRGLSKHPYFDGAQSKLVIAWRNQHGPLKQISDIGRAVPTANEEWLRKIEPYVSFE